MITQKAGRNAPEPRKARNIAVKIQNESTRLCGGCVAASGFMTTTLSVASCGVAVDRKDDQHEAVGDSEREDNRNRAGMIMPRWACAVATLAAHQVLDLEDGGDVRQGWLLATRRVPWASTAFGRAAGWPQSKTSASCCIKAAGLASAVK